MPGHEHEQGSGGGVGAGAMARMGGAVDVALKLAAGAGLAVVGAYLVGQARQRRDLAGRLDRLEALLKDLEQGQGGAVKDG